MVYSKASSEYGGEGFRCFGYGEDVAGGLCDIDLTAGAAVPGGDAGADGR